MSLILSDTSWPLPATGNNKWGRHWLWSCHLRNCRHRLWGSTWSTLSPPGEKRSKCLNFSNREAPRLCQYHRITENRKRSRAFVAHTSLRKVRMILRETELHWKRNQRQQVTTISHSISEKARWGCCYYLPEQEQDCPESACTGLAMLTTTDYPRWSWPGSTILPLQVDSLAYNFWSVVRNFKNMFECCQETHKAKTDYRMLCYISWNANEMQCMQTLVKGFNKLYQDSDSAAMYSKSVCQGLGERWKQVPIRPAGDIYSIPYLKYLEKFNVQTSSNLQKIWIAGKQDTHQRPTSSYLPS